MQAIVIYGQGQGRRWIQASGWSWGVEKEGAGSGFELGSGPGLDLWLRLWRDQRRPAPSDDLEWKVESPLP